VRGEHSGEERSREWYEEGDGRDKAVATVLAMVREMNGGREVEGEGDMQGVGREGGGCVR
jgi:hypothetical protein